MKQMIFCLTIVLITLSGQLVAGEETTWTEPSTGIEFVWVPGGCFQMGTPEGGTFYDPEKKEAKLFDGNVFGSMLQVAAALLPVGCSSISSVPANFNEYTMDERPVHEVCLEGFWIGKYEITQGQWQKVMGNNPSFFKSGDEYPVDTVSWDDSAKFVNALNDKTGLAFSLPTEAQWEYAARSAGKDEAACEEKNVDQVAWYFGNSGQMTHTVGTKLPNGLGIYDMRGNLREWCQDRYAVDAYREIRQEDPAPAPASEVSRVIRGGSWYLNSCDVRCTNRGWDWSSHQNSDVGFRIVRQK